MRKPSTALTAIAVVWLGSAYGIAQYAAPWLPRALASRLSLQSFLILALLTSSCLGLGLSAALLGRATRRHLAIETPTPSHVVVALLVAPVVVVSSMYLGFELALETLIVEIRAGGARAAQANTGEFGRAIVTTHVATTLLWATVVTPVVEELMFRGATWGAVEHLVAPDAKERRWLSHGLAPVVITTGLFTWLHADQPGGAGIVRAVQAGCLGFALGWVRYASKSLIPGIFLHAAFNLAAIAKSRKWFVSELWPPPLPIPLIYWQLAGICAVLILLWLVHRWPRLRTVRAHAAVFVARPPAPVFRFVVDPKSIALSFEGHGPIPGASHAEVVGDAPMRVGSRRRVHSDDGSVIEEVVVELEPPTRHSYEIVAGLKPPLSLLVVGGRGTWDIAADGDGTSVDWSFAWRLRSGWLWPVATLVRVAFAKAMKKCLLNHREHLEAQLEPHLEAPPLETADA